MFLKFLLLLLPLLSFSIMGVGNAIWIYYFSPKTFQDLTNFNLNNPQRAITTLYAYSGSIKYISSNPDLNSQYQVSFDQSLFSNYSLIVGVKSIVALIDGDLSGSASGMQVGDMPFLAQKITNLICNDDSFGGVQIDLEPYNSAPTVINALLSSLSSNLAGCKSSKFPRGKTVCFFGNAQTATPSFFKVLGSNGYYILSGYDLYGPPGTYSDTIRYGNDLEYQINLIISNIQTNGYGSYVVGIPGAASTNEFTIYYPNQQPQIVNPYKNFNNGNGYVEKAVEIIKKYNNITNGYSGTSLWCYSSVINVPYGSNNSFYPPTPFNLIGELEWLQMNMPSSDIFFNNSSSLFLNFLCIIVIILYLL